MPPAEELGQLHKRVEKIEHGHNELSQIMRDFQKDFHLLTNNMGELKTFLKEISETSTDMALFKQRYESHRETSKATTSRLFEEIVQMKKNQSRLVWLVITAVVGGLMKIVLVGV